MPLGQNSDDNNRISAATQSVVNTHILRRASKLVTQWAEEEKAKRNAVRLIAMFCIAAIALLIFFLLLRPVAELQPANSETRTHADSWRQGAVEAIHSSCGIFLPYEPFKVVVSVQINSSGNTEKVLINKSSGNVVADEKLVALLQSLKPLPPFSSVQRTKYDILEITSAFSVEAGKCNIR